MLLTRVTLSPCEQTLNPITPKSDLIDFTLSKVRRFYSSKGDPLGVKGFKNKDSGAHPTIRAAIHDRPFYILFTF